MVKSKDTPSHISIDPLGFYIHNICWIFFQTCMSQNQFKKCSNLCCSYYYKMYLKIKKLNLVIFTNALPPDKSLSQVPNITSPPEAKRNYSFPQSSIFSRFSFPIAARGEVTMSQMIMNGARDWKWLGCGKPLTIYIKSVWAL